jgi:16S rRNA (cytidine1402-2'-O)-methyltransferase
VAGLPTDRFFFEGFLPPKAGARRNRIAEIAAIQATVVIFEGGSRVAGTLADLATGLGAREAAVCRELTKLHEEVRRGPLATLAAEYAAGAETRGEFVLVIAPPEAAALKASDAEVHDLLRRALTRLSVKDAAAAVAEATGLARREVYQRALAMVKDDGPAA